MLFEIGFRHMFPVWLCKTWVSGCYFALIVTIKMLLPNCSKVHSYEMCAHLGTYFKGTIILYAEFMLYLITILCEDDFFYLYIHLYVIMLFIEGHKVK